MKFFNLITIIFSTLVLAGCITVVKDWTATGGSRADGVVRLSFEEASFEKVQLDENQAISVATQRCRSWGYTGAEAFGGITRQCVQSGNYGCMTWKITKEYQCTGEK